MLGVVVTPLELLFFLGSDRNLAAADGAGSDTAANGAGGGAMLAAAIDRR